MLHHLKLAVLILVPQLLQVHILLHVLLLVHLHDPLPGLVELSSLVLEDLVVEGWRGEDVELHVVDLLEFGHDLAGVFAFEDGGADHLALFLVLFELSFSGLLAGLVRGVHEFPRFGRVCRAFTHLDELLGRPQEYKRSGEVNPRGQQSRISAPEKLLSIKLNTPHQGCHFWLL